MATLAEVYERFPFNYDNFLRMMNLSINLDGGPPPVLEDLALAEPYNHDIYLKYVDIVATLGGEPPAAIEEEIIADWTLNVPITPIDFSNNFTGVVVSYGMTFVPTGLAFDTDTGILSGTPTTLGGGRPGVIAYGIEFDAACILDYSVGAA